MDWYYERDGSQAGPVKEAEIPALWREGLITPGTLVWHEGMADWQPYGEVEGATPLPQALPPSSVPTSPRHHYAGFWVRGVALVLDLVIVSLIRWLVLLPFGIGFIYEPPSTDEAMTLILLFILLSVGMHFLYQVFFWSGFGATAGKMLLRLRVVTPDGGPVSVVRAVGRYFCHILSGVLFGIGFMMAGWDTQKRSLHDRLAGTRVIRTVPLD